MVYRNAITPVFGLRREIDRLFEDTFGEGGTNTRAFGPSVDVHEDAQALTFEFELPGVNPDDVELSFENGVLTVRGEKRATREQKEGARYHHTERSYGTFTRSFQLPGMVEENAIEASFDHGVLSVRVPKARRPQPKKIEIRRGAAEQGAVQGANRSAGAMTSGDQPAAERGASGQASGESASAERPRGERGAREKSESR